MADGLALTRYLFTLIQQAHEISKSRSRTSPSLWIILHHNWALIAKKYVIYVSLTLMTSPIDHTLPLVSLESASAFIVELWCMHKLHAYAPLLPLWHIYLYKTFIWSKSICLKKWCFHNEHISFTDSSIFYLGYMALYVMSKNFRYFPPKRSPELPNDIHIS